jgi:hypothetical protein
MTWWRRQRAALIALLAAAVALVVVSLWLDVLPSRESAPPTPHVADGPIDLGGNRLELIRAIPDEFPAPDGAHTLSIRLAADSTEDAERCGTFTLREATGDREWLTAGSAVDVRYGDEESSCRKGTGSYRILTVFLLPNDADGPFWLDIAVGDDVVRFPVGD